MTFEGMLRQIQELPRHRRAALGIAVVIVGLIPGFNIVWIIATGSMWQRLGALALLPLAGVFAYWIIIGILRRFEIES